MSGYQALLALHLLAVALAIGIGFSNLVNMRISKGQTGDIAKGLGMHRLAMRKYTDIFISVIVLSGILLVWKIGGTSGLNNWFTVKMVAVAVLVGSYVALRFTVSQMLHTGNMALTGRVWNLAHLAVAAAAIAIITAVLTFTA